MRTHTSARGKVNKICPLPLRWKVSKFRKLCRINRAPDAKLHPCRPAILAAKRPKLLSAILLYGQCLKRGGVFGWNFAARTMWERVAVKSTAASLAPVPVYIVKGVASPSALPTAARQIITLLSCGFALFYKLKRVFKWVIFRDFFHLPVNAYLAIQTEELRNHLFKYHFNINKYVSGNS